MKHIILINKSLRLLAACGIFASASAWAGSDLAKAEIISKSGDWKVARTVDSMTDKLSCTGLYKNRFDIQLSPNRLYISMDRKGGVDGYTIRVDSDKPIHDIPTRFEKDLSTVVIGGESNEDKQVFARILQGSRLQVRVLTLLMTSEDYDIDLTGFADAYAVITGEPCGLSETALQPEQAKTSPSSTTVPPDVAGIIKKTDLLNDQCRDGSGDNPATAKACDSREKYTDLLKKKGWCWGNDSQIEADKTWGTCQ